ncbi:MAG: phosphoribosyl transferase [Acidobacteria bacterium RIFCSPLOWO2_12_FULL_67_14b]|nr:MAG: phosphoribosyl transferase [Acidobacteria bacterium RIFCSPLOWO2_12_FULL_67_14b]
MVVKLPAPFANRVEAGVALASHLQHYKDRSDVIVLGLPRGGVPVAAAVARSLGVRLDVFVVRKLGVPGHRELAMGAIASGGSQVLDDHLISSLQIPDSAIRAVAAEERRELSRRERLYRQDRPPLSLADQVVMLVDDGLATGSTMRAAVQAIRQLKPARIVVAVPVGSLQASVMMRQVADEVICAQIPRSFSAVGQWYVDFSETSDDEVRALLKAAAATDTPVEAQ